MALPGDGMTVSAAVGALSSSLIWLIVDCSENLVFSMLRESQRGLYWTLS